MLYCNKTSGYHRHLFSPPILLKMPFKMMKKFIPKKNFLHNFSYSNFTKFRNFLNFLQETSQYLSRGLLWENKNVWKKLCIYNFLRLYLKIFGLSAKKFRRYCQKCILGVHRNILGFFKKTRTCSP